MSLISVIVTFRYRNIIGDWNDAQNVRCRERSQGSGYEGGRASKLV